MPSSPWTRSVDWLRSSIGMRRYIYNIVMNRQTGEKKAVMADYIIGADGAFSASRLELMKREP